MRRVPRRAGLFALALCWVAQLTPAVASAALTPTLYYLTLPVAEVKWVVPVVIATRYEIDANGERVGEQTVPLQFAPARPENDAAGDLERRFMTHYLGDGPWTTSGNPKSITPRQFRQLVSESEDLFAASDPPLLKPRYRLMFRESGDVAGIDYEFQLPSEGDQKTYYLRPKRVLEGFEQNVVYATRDFRSARALFAEDESARNLTPTAARVRDVVVVELPGDPWELVPPPGTANAYVGDGGSGRVVFHYPEGLTPAPLLAIDIRLFDDDIDASMELASQVRQLARELDAGFDARNDPLLPTLEAMADQGYDLGPARLRDLAERARGRQQSEREGSRLGKLMENANLLYAAFNSREVRAYRAFVPRSDGEQLLRLVVQKLSEPELERVASNAIDTTRAKVFYKIGNDPEFWFEGVTPFGSLLAAQPRYRDVQTRDGEGPPRYFRIANGDQTRYFRSRAEAWDPSRETPRDLPHFGPRDWTPPAGFEAVGLSQIAAGGARYPAELRSKVDGSAFVLVGGATPFYIQAHEVSARQWLDFLEQLEPEAKKELLTSRDAIQKMQERGEPKGIFDAFKKLEDRQRLAARYFLPKSEDAEVAERGAAKRVGLVRRVKPTLRPPKRAGSKPVRTSRPVRKPVRKPTPQRVARKVELPDEYKVVIDDLARIPGKQPVRGVRPLDAYDLYGAWIGGDADVRLPSDAEWRQALPAAYPGLTDVHLLPLPAANLPKPLTRRALDGYPGDRSWSGARGLRGNVPEWTIVEAPKEGEGEVEFRIRGYAWDDNGAGEEDPHDVRAADAVETGDPVAGFRLVLIPHLQ